MELLQQRFKYDNLYMLLKLIEGDKLKMKIMFICTGNICRSAMAEGYMKKVVKEQKLDIDVCSSGIYGEEGCKASYLAKEAMSEYGVNLDSHVAKITSKTNIKDMDLILCATAGHKRILLQMYPDLSEKIYTMKEYAYDDERKKQDISDPWGYDITVYRRCASELVDSIDNIVRRIKEKNQ